MNLGEVRVGDYIDFIIDADPQKVLAHVEGLGERYEVRNVGDYTVIRIWKEREIETEVVEEEEFEINENTNVGKLIERYPEAIDILAGYGFTPLKNPILRKTLARTITLGRAKMLRGLSDGEFSELLEKLRAIARKS
jgi:hypothetical protein